MITSIPRLDHYQQWGMFVKHIRKTSYYSRESSLRKWDFDWEMSTRNKKHVWPCSPGACSHRSVRRFSGGTKAAWSKRIKDLGRHVTRLPRYLILSAYSTTSVVGITFRIPTSGVAATLLITMHDANAFYISIECLRDSPIRRPWCIVNCNAWQKRSSLCHRMS